MNRSLFAGIVLAGFVLAGCSNTPAPSLDGIGPRTTAAVAPAAPPSAASAPTAPPRASNDVPKALQPWVDFTWCLDAGNHSGTQPIAPQDYDACLATYTEQYGHLSAAEQQQANDEWKVIQQQAVDAENERVESNLRSCVEQLGITRQECIDMAARGEAS